MILKLITVRDVNQKRSVHELDHPNMEIDPRPIGKFHYLADRHRRFVATVTGTTLILDRIDKNTPNLRSSLWFRTYEQHEEHFSFKSPRYIYHGLENERAPTYATEVIVKEGVEIIRRGAFESCRGLVNICIPDSVKEIGSVAFSHCISLRSVRLPRNLEKIGSGAFESCISLEAIYLPRTLLNIGSGAFLLCKSLKILNIPDNFELMRHGQILSKCHALVGNKFDMAKYNCWLRNRYNGLQTLCCCPSVRAEQIRSRIVVMRKRNRNRLMKRRLPNLFEKILSWGKPEIVSLIIQEETAVTNDKPSMTALHLLAANPYVSGKMIHDYLELAPDVAVMQDDSGQTPLHVLCSLPCLSDTSEDAIDEFLRHPAGMKATFVKDYQGRTPFDCFCFSHSLDEVPFIKEKSFAGLIEWWFRHMDLELLGTIY